MNELVFGDQRKIMLHKMEQFFTGMLYGDEPDYAEIEDFRDCILDWLE
jgi:hypothetical protein